MNETYSSEQSSSLLSRGLLKNFILGALFFQLFSIIASFQFLALRIIVFIFSPLLSYLIILSLVSYYNYDDISENKATREIVEFAQIASVASVSVALMINTRGFWLILSILSTSQTIVSDVAVQLLVIAVYAPLVEEFLKLFPILVLFQGYFVDWGKRRKRVLTTRGSFLLTAVISGGTFTMLETYLYIIGADLLNDSHWNIVILQIGLRSLAPLHYATTLAMAIMMHEIRNSSRSTTLALFEYRPLFRGFLIAFAIHSLWNGMLVLVQGGVMSTILIADIPIQAYIFGTVILAFVIAVIRTRTYDSSHPCEICLNTHGEPYDLKSHIHSVEVLDIPSPNSIFYGRRRKCKHCNHSKETNPCQVCGSSVVNLCRNCFAQIPVHSTSCWNCNATLENAFDKSFTLERNLTNAFVNGFTIILGLVYFLSALVLAYVTLGVSDTSTYYSIFSFLALLGMVYLASYAWQRSTRRKAQGQALGRMLIGSFVVLVAFQMIILTLIFSGNVLAGLVASVPNFLLIAYAINLAVSYEAVFIGGNVG